MRVTYTRGETEFSVDTATLPAVSVDYLLQYGFAQSLQDCIAGLAKAKESELKETDSYKSGEMTDDQVADEVALAILTQLEKRTAAIQAGSVGVRVGQPRDEVTSLAREQVKAALAKAGKKADKDKLAELVKAHVEKNRDKIVAELARRKESAVEVAIDI